MKTFAVTFAGLATWYVEAETKKEAEEKAWKDLIKMNEDGKNLLLVAAVENNNIDEFECRNGTCNHAMH